MTGSQTAVREAMNRLLGISKDRDVANIKVATEEEVQAYNDGVVELELEPMRPYFGSPRPTAWNSGLFDLFIEHFSEENNVRLNVNQQADIEDMFESRIQTLRRKWQQVQNSTVEELKARKIRDEKMSRANSRRDRVSLLKNPTMI
jgi:hypothetical protein